MLGISQISFSKLKSPTAEKIAEREAAAGVMGRPRQRPLVEPDSTQVTPRGSRQLCTLESAQTPGGSRCSPIVYMQELQPAEECRSARKRRLDRNRQAQLYAAHRLARGRKTVKQSALDFERRIVNSVSLEQPEQTFDVSALDQRILTAQHARRRDQREAARILRQGDCELDEQVRAAVHLMMGRELNCKWTPTGKLRAACDVCMRSYAVTSDGKIRRHNGCTASNGSMDAASNECSNECCLK